MADPPPPRGATATSSSGLRIQANASIQSQRPMGLLFVICSYGYRELDTQLNRRILRSAASKARTIVGMDTGAWLLAGPGLLDGRRATIHWHVLDAFLETFVLVAGAQQSFVADGKFITSGGAAAAYDLAQCIIGETAGCSLSLDVGTLFVRDTERVRCRPQNSSNSRLTSNALALMQSTIEAPITVKDIADRIASTQRQLERDFRKEFGAAPNQVYRKLRLSAVRRFLEDTRLPISEIAVRTGYQNASAMSRAFRTEYGYSPRAFRLEIEGAANRMSIRPCAVKEQQ
ncbi:MAG: GlxA family transcriptional regulator [Hyphomicrobiaceae bacterium]